MNLHAPHLLWLLLLPLAGLLWEYRRRQRGAVALHPKILRAEAGPDRLVLTAADRAAGQRLRVRWRLWLGVALALAALSRPQWGRIEEVVFDQSREILIAVDLSRSMLAPDVKPSRLERAKLLIASLLDQLKGERVGLIVFSGTAFLQSPLSSDYEVLREFLPALNPDYIPAGGTNYRALLEASLSAFSSSSSADRFLIVLSDGESTTGDWRPLAEQLKSRQIQVLGLGVGTTEGAMIPDGANGFVKDERGAVVLSRLQSSTLQELAAQTDGVYTDASSWVDVAQLIRTTVEKGQRGEFMERNRVRWAERFQWLLAPALGLLLWSAWREFPVQPRARSLAPPPTTRPPPPRPTASNSARRVARPARLALLLGFALPGDSDAATPPVPPPGKPLAQLVERLSGQSALAATELADLARATVTYGQGLQAARQAVPPGPLRDGLDAVEQGRKLDPRAADWEELRRQLEALRPPPESPPPEEPPPQQDDSSGENDSSQKSPPQPQSGDASGQPNPSSSPDGPSGDPEDNATPEPKSSPDQTGDSRPPESKPQDGQSAFGDMQKQPPDAPSAEPTPSGEQSEPRSGETQTFGGTNERRPASDHANPALSLPLHKLEQLRQQDSPAKLFQLMEGPSQNQAAKPEKDW